MITSKARTRYERYAITTSNSTISPTTHVSSWSFLFYVDLSGKFLTVEASMNLVANTTTAAWSQFTFTNVPLTASQLAYYIAPNLGHLFPVNAETSTNTLYCQCIIRFTSAVFEVYSTNSSSAAERVWLITTYPLKSALRESGWVSY